jgi:hypothetical protein
VEVPVLSELLTTNKSDFLTTPGALKKYYEVRKAIQRAVMPVLRELGEIEDQLVGEKTPTELKPLTQDIEGALSLLSKTFPELESFVGEHWRRRLASEATRETRKRKQKGAVLDVQESTPSATSTIFSDQTRARRPLQPDETGTQTKRERQPGLEIVFEECSGVEQDVLGKFVGERIAVNTSHPAWIRAKSLGQEPYHVLLAVALLLAENLQPSEGTHDFVSRFLKAWSEAAGQSGKLL